jgi:nucleoid-associated protein YgaU
MSQGRSHAVEGAPEQPPETSEEPAPRLRVLWGRFVALAFVIAMSFFAGWLVRLPTVDAARLRALEADLAEANARIEDLESAGRLASEPTPAPEEALRGEDNVDEQPEKETVGDKQVDPSSETYVVRAGDTLQGIADRFYEEPALADVIAEANGIEDPALIHAGLELEIPERPEL